MTHGPFTGTKLPTGAPIAKHCHGGISLGRAVSVPASSARHRTSIAVGGSELFEDCHRASKNCPLEAGEVFMDRSAGFGTARATALAAEHCLSRVELLIRGEDGGHLDGATPLSDWSCPGGLKR